MNHLRRPLASGKKNTGKTTVMEGLGSGDAPTAPDKEQANTAAAASAIAGADITNASMTGRRPEIPASSVGGHIAAASLGGLTGAQVSFPSAPLHGLAGMHNSFPATPLAGALSGYPHVGGYAAGLAGAQTGLPPGAGGISRPEESVIPDWMNSAGTTALGPNWLTSDPAAEALRNRGQSSANATQQRQRGINNQAPAPSRATKRTARCTPRAPTAAALGVDIDTDPRFDSSDFDDDGSSSDDEEWTTKSIELIQSVQNNLFCTALIAAGTILHILIRMRQELLDKVDMVGLWKL